MEYLYHINVVTHLGKVHQIQGVFNYDECQEFCELFLVSMPRTDDQNISRLHIRSHTPHVLFTDAVV